MAPFSETLAPTTTKEFLHANNNAVNLSTPWSALHMPKQRAEPTSIEATASTDSTSLPSTDTKTGTRTLQARGSSSASSGGGGSINPNKLHSAGFLALFAILGAAFVIGAIWFFFWARNGGFHWRGRDDWEDYKSSVLRRKDEFGRPLSTATPSTRLGQGSVLFPPSTVAPGNAKTPKVEHRYMDDDGDDGGTGGVGNHGERSGSRGEHDNAGGDDNMMTEMRNLMTKPKEKKKKSGFAARLFRRRKDDHRDVETPRDEEEIPVLEPPSHLYPPGVETNANDSDIKAYRSEQPAAVGGINAPSERTHSEHSYPTAHSSPDRHISGYSFVPGEEDVVNSAAPPRRRSDYRRESNGNRRTSRGDRSRRRSSQRYDTHYHDDPDNYYENDYATDPSYSSPQQSSHARRRRERQLERERSLVADEDTSDPFSSPVEDRRQRERERSRRYSGYNHQYYQEQPEYPRSRSRHTRDPERTRRHRSSRSYAPRNSYYADDDSPEELAPDVDLDREYRNAVGMSKGYRRSGTGYHDRYHHRNHSNSNSNHTSEASAKERASRRRRDSLSDSEDE